MINKETYFDFIEKKLNQITRGQDLTFGELDECFFKLNSLKKDYLKQNLKIKILSKYLKPHNKVF